MARFWEARRTGVLQRDDPIIFGASIATIRKYSYEDRLWEVRSAAGDLAGGVIQPTEHQPLCCRNPTLDPELVITLV